MGATGAAPGPDADLRIDEGRVNEDLGFLKLYPVLSIGVGVRL